VLSSTLYLMTSFKVRISRLSKQSRAHFGFSPNLRAGVLVLLTALTAGAADIQGWSNARWGMTEQQILDAFPNAVRLPKPEKFDAGPAPISIPAFQVEHLTLRIFFLMTPTLSQVAFDSKAADPYDFQILEALLVRQYGRPWQKTTDEVQIAQWTLPSTIITLRRASFRNIRVQFLTLTYELRQVSPF